MSQLVFDEATLMNGNIFKFEERLKSHVNKYIEGGAILTTYFHQDENASTVDRGLQDIEELFGKNSPLRFNQIRNCPLYAFSQANPENSDEQQIEDIAVEGECIILPSTIVPKPYDCFIVNHLKMKALFQVTNVQYDSMKVEGYYKIRYRLHSTNEETIQQLMRHVIGKYEMELNAIGTNLNPVIQEDEYAYRVKVLKMVDKMIESYKALFYNEKHNCFLYHDNQTGLDWFDLCGNEFIAKHGLLNSGNATDVIILHNKIRDIQLPLFYNNSVYNWLELGAPERLLQKFFFILNDAEGYNESSFVLWGDGDIQVMQPITVNQAGINWQNHSIFDAEQLSAFINKDLQPVNEMEKLIWLFIHNGSTLRVQDISLYLADALLSSVKNIDTYLYTPIILYIIQVILGLN